MLSYLNSCSFFSSTPIDPKVERKATGEVQFNINKFKTNFPKYSYKQAKEL